MHLKGLSYIVIPPILIFIKVMRKACLLTDAWQEKMPSDSTSICAYVHTGLLVMRPPTTCLPCWLRALRIRPRPPPGHSHTSALAASPSVCCHGAVPWCHHNHLINTRANSHQGVYIYMHVYIFIIRTLSKEI